MRVPTPGDEPSIRIYLAGPAYGDQPSLAIPEHPIASDTCTAELGCNTQRRYLAARPDFSCRVPAGLSRFGRVDAQETNLLSTDFDEIATEDGGTPFQASSIAADCLV